MTYYERLKNKYDRHLYEYSESKEENVRKLLKKKKNSEQKNLYKLENRKEEGV